MASGGAVFCRHTRALLRGLVPAHPAPLSRPRWSRTLSLRGFVENWSEGAKPVRVDPRYTYRGPLRNYDELQPPEPAEGSHTEVPTDAHVVSGVDLLRNPKYNKGMAFTEREREKLYLKGLLPPHLMPMDVQVERVLTNLASIDSNLNKYSHLTALQERNSRLFYRVLRDHFEDMLPIIYNPTVALACQKYGLMFRRPRGLFLTIQDRGQIYSLMKNWPERRVRMIIVTDGERVGSVGDLGIQGMGVSVSKAALYTAGGGYHPHEILPVALDFGTDNEISLKDKFYIGLRHRRVRGQPYDELVDEFVQAAKKRFGENVLIQFENFSYVNSAHLLLQYRGEACVFNDDLQGAAAVALAGLMSACRSMTKTKGLHNHTFLFVGAGEAGTSIVDLLVFTLIRYCKLSIYEAKERVWLFDSKGLVVRSRVDEVQAHKVPYAQHEHPECSDLIEAIRQVKPTCLVGTSTTSSTKAGTFTEAVITEMSNLNEQPVIFALSGWNNTVDVGSSEMVKNQQECTAADAYKWSKGKAVFLGGAPEPPLIAPDRPTQIIRCATSVYLFPGIALGVRLSSATHVRDEMMVAAAQELANQVTAEDRAQGSIYPCISRIREISVKVANAVASVAYEKNIARELPRPRSMLSLAKKFMYRTVYNSYN